MAKRAYHNWTADELERLRNEYPTASSKEVDRMAYEIGVTIQSLRMYAKGKGIHKIVPTTSWTAEKIEILKRNAATAPSVNSLARRLEIAPHVIKAKAEELGLVLNVQNTGRHAHR